MYEKMVKGDFWIILIFLKYCINRYEVFFLFCFDKIWYFFFIFINEYKIIEIYGKGNIKLYLI